MDGKGRGFIVGCTLFAGIAVLLGVGIRSLDGSNTLRNETKTGIPRPSERDEQAVASSPTRQPTPVASHQSIAPPVEARERASMLQERLLSGEATSPAEVTRALEQAVWCRSEFIKNPPFPGREKWWDSARRHCDGVFDTEFPSQIEELVKSRSTSGVATTEALVNAEASSGQDSAIGAAERILMTSADPATLASASRYLAMRGRSLVGRLAGGAIHPGSAMEIESSAIVLYSCSLQRDCGPQAFETIRYCLHSKVPCPEGATLDVAMRDTQAAYTWQRIWTVASFFLTPPPRSLPR